MSYEQPDLFSSNPPIDPSAVDKPTPRAAVHYERIPASRQIDPCAHCVLVAAAASRLAAHPTVRLAGWRRFGLLGCVTLLCGGHRRLLQEEEAAA